MDKAEVRRVIAKRVALELEDDNIVNLGIGLPTLVANYIPKDRGVTLHSENGYLGIGPEAPTGMEDPEIISAGGSFTTIEKGGAFFDSCSSFTMIRGGHVDVTVLGAFQVDMHGNIASWIIPGGKLSGMGGAMDLIVGSKKVIVAIEHTVNGQKKILSDCNLPLTAENQANLIITQMAVIEVTAKGLVLKEVGAGFSVDDVIKNTEAPIQVSDSLGSFGL